MEYQAERAIQTAVATCYRAIDRRTVHEPAIAAALEQFSVTVDQGEISGVPLLRLLAGLTTPAKLLRELKQLVDPHRRLNPGALGL